MIFVLWELRGLSHSGFNFVASAGYEPCSAYALIVISFARRTPTGDDHLVVNETSDVVALGVSAYAPKPCPNDCPFRIFPRLKHLRPQQYVDIKGSRP
jgi:hypothetical protein